MPKHKKSLSGTHQRARGGDENTKPQQNYNNQPKQEMILEQNSGPIGAVTPDRAESETTPVKNAVPDEIQQSAGVEVKPEQLGQATMENDEHPTGPNGMAAPCPAGQNPEAPPPAIQTTPLKDGKIASKASPLRHALVKSARMDPFYARMDKEKAKLIKANLEKPYVRLWELQLPSVNDHKAGKYFSGNGNQWRDDFVIRHTLQARISDYVRAEVPFGTQPWVASEALRNAARLIESRYEFFAAGRSAEYRATQKCYHRESELYVRRELSLKSIVEFLQIDMSTERDIYGCDEFGDDIHAHFKRDLTWPESLTVSFPVGEDPLEAARFFYRAAEWLCEQPGLLECDNMRPNPEAPHRLKIALGHSKQRG